MLLYKIGSIMVHVVLLLVEFKIFIRLDLILHKHGQFNKVQHDHMAMCYPTNISMHIVA